MVEKGGRPSLSALMTKTETNAAIPVPVSGRRFSSVGHLPNFVDKQGQCRHCPKGFTSIQCVKQKISLCIRKYRNCFYNYHVPSQLVLPFVKQFMKVAFEKLFFRNHSHNTGSPDSSLLAKTQKTVITQFKARDNKALIKP